MKKSLMFFICLLLLLAGCNPSQEEYDRAQSLDINNIHGTVTSKEVAQFKSGDGVIVGDNKVGDFYNCLTIQVTNGPQVIYKGVRQETFDAVMPGDILPKLRFITTEDLLTIQGTVVDTSADLKENRFRFVVDNNIVIRIYHTDITTYYRYILKGKELPIKLPIKGE